MSNVTRAEVRGQCEKGHVDSCPLPDCSHEIVWQRRPDYLTPTAGDGNGRPIR